jgi:hypothetical protein
MPEEALCTSPPRVDGPLLFRHLVRIDHVARLVFGRRYDDLGREVLELAEIGALDVLELDLKDPRLRPLALGSELHVTNQGLERRLADVIGELVVIEALRGAM